MNLDNLGKNLDKLLAKLTPGPRRKKQLIRLTATGAILAAIALCVGGYFYLRHAAFPVLSPHGPIAADQRNLFLFACALAVIVVVPVFAMLIYFCWKYRATNTKAKYEPDWDNSNAAEAVWWLVPLALIGILSVVTWTSSHRLDPFRAIDSDVKPLNIQVVAMQWKWLFIYPDQDIATVNYVQIPEKTPVQFTITSDASMNSFWVPSLAGQIYAMSGMSTQLHLMADHPGSYDGVSANLSGAGFANMRFLVKSSSSADFDAWVQTVKRADKPLDTTAYATLSVPNVEEAAPVTYYSSTEAGLYDTIVMKYMMPGHYTPPLLPEREHAQYDQSQVIPGHAHEQED